jgi:hypothetical protein
MNLTPGKKSPNPAGARNAKKNALIRRVLKLPELKGIFSGKR